MCASFWVSVYECAFCFNVIIRFNVIKIVRLIKCAVCVLTVQVTDTNDNAPSFTEAAYSFDIPEDTGRGAFVGAVSVTDLDEGVNAQVSYTVLSDWGNDVFSLNPQSGVFTLTSRLDYEQVINRQQTMLLFIGCNLSFVVIIIIIRIIPVLVLYLFCPYYCCCL